ncbi:MAG: 2-oxo acid dehydrogenase subunit E2 [Anaerolineaceae bacterium]|nr:2-oxo acid dehydrogenase subunit E2 [Anaerolineaceae bacterium]
MATYFAMPKLGLNMTHGVILGWLAEEGDEIEEGAPLVEVETDKAAQDVEAPVSGVLAKILKAVGEEVPCNSVIAVITAQGEALPNDIPGEVAKGVAPKLEIQSVSGSSAKSPATEKSSASQKRVSISPSARKLAAELGVDISTIVPKGSRIKREDVEAARLAMQAGATSTGQLVTKQVMTSTRRKIADRMNKSARTVARVGMTVEVDATKFVAKRQSTLIDGKKVSYNVLLAKQVATALKAFPYMNAQINGDDIWEFEDVNIGIAVDTERGLLVPVMQAVNRKDVETLQKEFLSMTGRAVEGKSTISDLGGGTFTITNLGSLDIDSFLPVINVPECAVLGMGAIVEKPIVEDGVVKVRPLMKMTLAFDHRLVDGAPAGRFLKRLKELIEEMAD